MPWHTVTIHDMTRFGIPPIHDMTRFGIPRRKEVVLKVAPVDDVIPGAGELDTQSVEPTPPLATMRAHYHPNSRCRCTIWLIPIRHCSCLSLCWDAIHNSRTDPLGSAPPLRCKFQPNPFRLSALDRPVISHRAAQSA